MNDLQRKIVEEVKDCGISSCHVTDLFGPETMDLYNQADEYFQEFLANPKIVDRVNKLAAGTPIRDRSKWYEVTCYEHLGRGLNLTDGGIVNMYLSDELLDIAAAFHGEEPIIRNVLTWVHPKNKLQSEIASQRWHRDQEDWSIFKVFIYFSDVAEENGALEYAKHTAHGYKYGDITNNFNGQTTSTFFYEIPKENFVRATGPKGTIYFVNTNGMHKGGLVQDGIRRLTQGCYVTRDAYIISKAKKLLTYDYEPKINTLDRNSEAFQNLTERQQAVLS